MTYTHDDAMRDLDALITDRRCQADHDRLAAYTEKLEADLATERKVSEWLAEVICRVGDYTELYSHDHPEQDWRWWADRTSYSDDPIATVLAAAREAVKDD